MGKCAALIEKKRTFVEGVRILFDRNFTNSSRKFITILLFSFINILNQYFLF
jgi:hypothetical protein